MTTLSNINLSKTIRSLIISSAFASFLLFVSFNVQAADKVNTPEQPVEFKYIGSIDNKPVLYFLF